MKPLDRRTSITGVAAGPSAVAAAGLLPEGAGTASRVRGRRLPAWKLRHGWADEVPVEPQTSEEPLEELTLIPYGCTNIRVTEFPRLKG